MMTTTAGPNILLMSNAGKPIFSRYPSNDEDLVTICGLIQAVRANAIDVAGGDIGSINSNCHKFFFLHVGALTLVAVTELDECGECETEAFLRLQLEYVYGYLIFMLTDEVQMIFAETPNVDLREMLGTFESDVRDFLDNSCHLGNEGLYWNSGVEVWAPLSFEIRESVSRSMLSIFDPHDVLAVMLTVGSKLITMLQPHNPRLQLQTSDLHLVLSFLSKKGSLPSNELWVPLCLPRFNSSGFVHAYHSCINDDTDLRLIILSPQYTTDQFNVLRAASSQFQQTLGLNPSDDQVIQIHESRGHEPFLEKQLYDTNNSLEDKNGTHTKPNVNASIHLVNSILDKHLYHTDNSLEDNYGTDTKPNVNASIHLVNSIQEAITSRTHTKLQKDYCHDASVIHFLFRTQVPIRTPTNIDTGGTLSQCLSPPLRAPFIHGPAKRKVWNTYQKLSLRLRFGSATLEATMDALDMGTEDSSSKPQNMAHACSAQKLLDLAPHVEGVTYELEKEYLFMGLSGKTYELYAILEGNVHPKEGASLCARFIQRLLNDKGDFFISNPLALHK